MDTQETTVLYTRVMAQGPLVRIRRTSVTGSHPVVAVLEVDRRSTTPRGSRGGSPPPLMIVEGKSEVDVLAQLKPQADDDVVIARLMQGKGLR
jgi:hypothetical protein